MTSADWFDTKNKQRPSIGVAMRRASWADWSAPIYWRGHAQGKLGRLVQSKGLLLLLRLLLRRGLA